MDAQVIYDRQPGGDLNHGPCEFVRVGFRVNDLVFWIGSAHFPGDNGIQFMRDERLSKEIVDHLRARATP